MATANLGFGGPDASSLSNFVNNGTAASGAGTGLFDGPGWQNVMMGLALMDASRRRVNPPPLIQTLGPMMQMQAQLGQQNKAMDVVARIMQNAPRMPTMPDVGTAAAAPSTAPGGLFAQTAGTGTGQTAPGGLFAQTAGAGAGQLASGGAVGTRVAGLSSGEYAPLIQEAAAAHGIPVELLTKQIAQESSFNPNARSPAGALGIAQFMPGTAKRFGIDPLDPKQAIPAAAQYDAQNRDMFGGNLGLGLAGYNWGEGNVQKWLQKGADPAAMPAETRNYVANITGQPIDAWVNGSAQAQSIPTGVAGTAAPRIPSGAQYAQAAPLTMTDAAPQRQIPAPAALQRQIPAPANLQPQFANMVRNGMLPPGVLVNSQGMPYSADLTRMTPQEQGNERASYAALRGAPNAGGVPLPAPTAPGAMSQIQPAPSQPGAMMPNPIAAAAQTPTGAPAGPSMMPNLALGASGGASQPAAAPAATSTMPNPLAFAGQAPAAALGQDPTAAGQAPAAFTPTRRDVAQAQAIMPTTPAPPSPDTATGLTTQRAFAIRSADYWTRALIASGYLGDVGSGIKEAAKLKIDLAQKFMTEEQTRELDLRYKPLIEEQTRRTLLPVFAQEKAIEQQAQFLGPGASVGLQSQLAQGKAAAEAPYRMTPTRPGSYVVDGNGRVVNVTPTPITTVDEQGNKHPGYTTPPIPGAQGPAGQAQVTTMDATTGLGPGVEHELMTRATEEQKQRQLVINEGNAAQQQYATLMNMANEAGNFTQGPFSQHAQQAASYLRLIDPSYDKQVASYENFVKNAGSLTRQAVRDVSSRAAVQEFNMVASTLPNPDMSPIGLQRVQNELIGLSDYKMAKAQAQQQWEQQQGGIGKVSGFETDFQKRASPYAFIVSRMSAPDRQEMILKLQASDQGRREIARLGEQIQYLKQSGLVP